MPVREEVEDVGPSALRQHALTQTYMAGIERASDHTRVCILSHILSLTQFYTYFLSLSLSYPAEAFFARTCACMRVSSLPRILSPTHPLSLSLCLSLFLSLMHSLSRTLSHSRSRARTDFSLTQTLTPSRLCSLSLSLLLYLFFLPINHPASPSPSLAPSLCLPLYPLLSPTLAPSLPSSLFLSVSLSFLFSLFSLSVFVSSSTAHPFPRFVSESTRACVCVFVCA